MIRIPPSTFEFNQGQIKVHAISTGLVAVKKSFRESRYKGIFAILSSFLDRKFTEWMPIWVWVIEHPEGVFVIDTGENSRVNDPGYFKSSGRFENWLNTTQFKFQVDREEEIDQQLTAVGLSTAKVDKVILTHLHLDHIDGLVHFPDAEILVSRSEWEKPYGDLPKLYPSWLSPTLLDLETTYEGFERATFLSEAKDLVLIETPGHTYGHCSIALQTDAGLLFFAADVVYYEEQLRQSKFSAGTVSWKTARKTYDQLLALASKVNLILLPSHEAANVSRLQLRQFFKVD